MDAAAISAANANRHYFACQDCGADAFRDLLATAYSDAEWHNTNTGHDVRVITVGGDTWELTEQGWVELIPVTMWGGYSYDLGESEAFLSVRAACEAYVDRYNSNGVRKIDGVFWPTWGDAPDDEYVIVVGECDGLTRSEVFAIVNDNASHYLIEEEG